MSLKSDSQNTVIIISAHSQGYHMQRELISQEMDDNQQRRSVT